MRFSKKMCAVFLTALLLLLCILPGVSAQSAAPEVTISPNRENASAVVQISFPEAAKQEVSLLCLDPSYTYSPESGIADWTAHSSSLVELRQVKLDAAGKASVTVKLAEVKDGLYTLSLGVGGATYEKQFSFQTAPALSVTSDKDSYTVRETITLTVRAPKEVTTLKLFNVNDNGVGTTILTVQPEGGDNLWTVTTAVGTAGAARVLTFKGFDKDKTMVASGSVTVVIVEEDAVVLSAQLLTPGPISANSPFSIQIVTTTAVAKIALSNEFGKGLGKTQVARVNHNGLITWEFSLAIGTPGVNRQIKISLTDKTGSVITDATQIAMDVL